MYAKSGYDRLQKLLRYAGHRAPLRGSSAILALLFVLSASVFLAMDERVVTSDEPATSASVAETANQPPAASATTPAPSTATRHVHAEETRNQALAQFLSRKYKVSERVILNLIGMAHSAGRQIGLDPLLIIAVMAVESRFNPIAESIAGAKGLMQVIPKYHHDKLKTYGGEDSVFDPQTNILVGSQILKEYIVKTGSVNMALQMYAGALNDAEDIYTTKVMTEKERLQQVVSRPASGNGGKRPKGDAATAANTPI